MLPKISVCTLMSMVFPWFSLFKIFKTEISARNLFGTRGCGPCRGLLPGRHAVGQCLVGSNGARLGGATLPGGAAAPGRGQGSVLWNPADGGSARRTLWLCQQSYRKSPFSMGKSTLNGHFPVRYLCLPKGKDSQVMPSTFMTTRNSNSNSLGRSYQLLNSPSM